MRKISASFATVLASLALCGSGVPNAMPDSRVAYARRGSLGANDYVATNVYPVVTAYRIVRVTDGRLRDRAVNVVDCEARTLALAHPARRSTAGFARGFILGLKVEAEGPCALFLSGAGRINSTDGTERLVAKPGRTVFSFIETRDGEYLVEFRDLTEISQEDSDGNG